MLTSPILNLADAVVGQVFLVDHDVDSFILASRFGASPVEIEIAPSGRYRVERIHRTDDPEVEDDDLEAVDDAGVRWLVQANGVVRGPAVPRYAFAFLHRIARSARRGRRLTEQDFQLCSVD